MVHPQMNTLGRAWPVLAVCCLAALHCAPAHAAAEVLLAKGELLRAEVSGASGSWQINGAALRIADVLCIRFSPEPPPSTMASGVFIRGGSWLTGSLANMIGQNAEVNSSVLGALQLKRGDIAGALFPPPAGQTETLPEASRYSAIAMAALGSPGAWLEPGLRNTLRLASQDEVQAESIMRVGTDQILVSFKDKGAEPINRQAVRTLEFKVPPLPRATPEDERFGPEIVVRLKTGDLLRGRMVRLNAQGLTLQTTFAGERTLPPPLLASVFPAGGEDSGTVWLSSQKPLKALHVPLFDAAFAARMDSSADRNILKAGGAVCERGIGVHSRSELEYALTGKPAHFVSLCGIDAETRGRGGVVARVLADGKEVWKSAPLSGRDAPVLVYANLGSAKTLSLIVEFGPDGDDSGDHFDWGWAAVVTNP